MRESTLVTQLKEHNSLQIQKINELTVWLRELFYRVGGICEGAQ